MKRALSLALAFVLALTLTACGKKDTGTDSDSNVPTDALTLLNSADGGSFVRICYILQFRLV